MLLPCSPESIKLYEQLREPVNHRDAKEFADLVWGITLPESPLLPPEYEQASVEDV